MRTKTGILAAVMVLVWTISGNLLAKDLPKGTAERIVLKVQGMTCTGCEAKVERALQKVRGVEKVDADFTTGRVVIEAKTKIGKATLRKTVEKTGFKLVGEKMKTGKGVGLIDKDCDGKGCCSRDVKTST